MPAAWPDVSAAPQSTAEDMQGWWRCFEDPVLDRLIERVLVDNPDLRAVEAGLQAATARVGVAMTARLPQLDLVALAEIRYREVYVSILELLGAQRGLLGAEPLLAQSRADHYAATATRFKALGGGWEQSW